ncbi:ATP-binding protein [Streptomyces sp. NBC_01498]|nr:ATP-binding protein [Streptomyces sp. NBC_01498]WTL28796.1 ATP-binding protein [Streptomyces sp. NBC_01498]
MAYGRPRCRTGRGRRRSQRSEAYARKPTRTIETAEQVTAELAARAATHGRLSGRDFLLELHRADDGHVLRIEVTDTRGDRLPVLDREQPSPDDESGRGLLLVEALADRWGVVSGPVPRKTVWAELDLVRPDSPVRVNTPN